MTRTDTEQLDRWLRRLTHNEFQRSADRTHAESLAVATREVLAAGDVATATCMASQLIDELRGRDRWGERLAREVYNRLVRDQGSGAKVARQW